MSAALRRGIRVLLIVLMLGTIGASIGASEVAAAPDKAASSATPGVPTSTIKSTSGNTVTYCVTGYAPNSDVVVVNKLTGATATIHTDSTGAGCTTVPVSRACGPVSQTIVATGTGTDGKPATSQVVYNAPPETGGACVVTTSPTPTPTSTCAATGATLSVYSVPEGSDLRGTACGFTPGETVFVYLLSKPIFVGSTTASAAGIAAKTVSIPTCITPGQHSFEFVGQSSGTVASADFTVTKAGNGCSSVAPVSGAGGGGNGGANGNGGGNGGPNGSGGGTLAFTGADIAAMVLVALVLLALGTIALVTVRRRRTASAV